MAVLSESKILSVWNALRGDSEDHGWRSIELVEVGSCRIRASIHFPGNEEAVLVGLPKGKIGPASQFPQGQGFRMERLALNEPGAGYEWLAIVRQSAGSLELFATVVADIAKLLQSCSECSEDVLYQRFLGRVRGWQEFMRKGRGGLNSESEQGLVGELFILQRLIDEGVLLYTIADSWKGPYGGLHDFQIGLGAVEVKSTMAVEGFPVRIASLEQLDDSQNSPLYLAAMRFSSTDRGVTLPDLIRDVLKRLEVDPMSIKLFEDALTAVGYLEIHSEMYTRRYQIEEIKVHLVDESFPRLVSYNIPHAVRRAQYELDLSSLDVENHSLTKVLKHLGVL